MKITVVGTGYVGLVSGVCFSEFGFSVICVDNNVEKIEQLRRSEVPILERDLDKLLAKNVNAGRLSFTSDMAEGVKDADIIFIAVGTPSKNDGEADLSYVYAAVSELSKHINKDAVLVIKSTVPVGTTRSIKRMLTEAGVNVDVSFNPEFLREGVAIEDFMRPDRVIIGVETDRAKKILKKVYRPLYAFNIPILFTNLETAELSKYASNAFLAAKICFINEIADLCEKCGADVNNVAIAMGMDHRIGDKFLQAGPGYGGSCFPKDTLALANFSEKFGVKMKIVEQVIKSNNERKKLMVEKIFKACGNEVKDRNISVLGVTFKANTDDMRESPSIEILNALTEAGARLRIYDPSFSKAATELFSKARWSSDAYSNCENADAVVVLTEWPEFRALNLYKLKSKMRTPIMVDLRNMYGVEEAEAAGLIYYSVGRSSDFKTKNS